jgi:hypothetical protein
VGEVPDLRLITSSLRAPRALPIRPNLRSVLPTIRKPLPARIDSIPIVNRRATRFRSTALYPTRTGAPLCFFHAPQAGPARIERFHYVKSPACTGYRRISRIFRMGSLSVAILSSSTLVRRWMTSGATQPASHPRGSG